MVGGFLAFGFTQVCLLRRLPSTNLMQGSHFPPYRTLIRGFMPFVPLTPGRGQGCGHHCQLHPVCSIDDHRDSLQGEWFSQREAIQDVSADISTLNAPFLPSTQADYAGKLCIVTYIVGEELKEPQDSDSPPKDGKSALDIHSHREDIFEINALPPSSVMSYKPGGITSLLAWCLGRIIAVLAGRGMGYGEAKAL